MKDIEYCDLSNFGYRELKEAMEILQAIIDNGYPDDFYDEGIQIGFNPNSGYVFLTNADYQTAMVVDGKLESWYFTPYEGHEGFYEDLVDEMDDSWNSEDIEYVKDLADNRGDEEVVERCDALLGNGYDEEE